MDMALAPSCGAEADYPTQIYDEAKNTKWRNSPPPTGEEKGIDTDQKQHKRPKSQQQHLFTRYDEGERRQENFDLEENVCQTEDLKKFDLVEVKVRLI